MVSETIAECLADIRGKRLDYRNMRMDLDYGNILGKHRLQKIYGTFSKRYFKLFNESQSTYNIYKKKEGNKTLGLLFKILKLVKRVFSSI